MLRGFIVWPQLTSVTGTSNAFAIRARSSGLGVQRPSAIAATRSTVSPARSATSSIAKPVCSNKCSTVFIMLHFTTTLLTQQFRFMPLLAGGYDGVADGVGLWARERAVVGPQCERE